MTNPDTPEPPDVDPELAEEFAEQVGVDPTHEEVDRYLELGGAEPLGEDRDDRPHPDQPG